MAEDDDRIVWRVNVNNGQVIYLVRARDAGTACVIAGDNWRKHARGKRLERGIYDIRASHAKFGEIRNGPVIE